MFRLLAGTYEQANRPPIPVIIQKCNTPNWRLIPVNVTKFEVHFELYQIMAGEPRSEGERFSRLMVEADRLARRELLVWRVIKVFIMRLMKASWTRRTLRRANNGRIEAAGPVSGALN